MSNFTDDELATAAERLQADRVATEIERFIVLADLLTAEWEDLMYGEGNFAPFGIESYEQSFYKWLHVATCKCEQGAIQFQANQVDELFVKTFSQLHYRVGAGQWEYAFRSLDGASFKARPGLAFLAEQACYHLHASHSVYPNFSAPAKLADIFFECDCYISAKNWAETARSQHFNLDPRCDIDINYILDYIEDQNLSVREPLANSIAEGFPSKRTTGIFRL